MNPWKPELLARHLTIFPEGQLVAVDESGRVLGSASSLIIDWDDYAEFSKMVGDHRRRNIRYP